MTPPRILIAGIGNIFLGDDGFGSQVAWLLSQRPAQSGVHVNDFGIRGLDLAYALLDDYDAAILVDTAQRGGPPGTLYVIEPEPEPDTAAAAPSIDAHSLDPAKVLRLARSLGSLPNRVFVVGCEPATFGSDLDPVMGLSAPVSAAVAQAIPLINSIIDRVGANHEGSLPPSSFSGEREEPPCWKNSPASAWES
jgi:hydrogenase maturation protease